MSTFNGLVDEFPEIRIDCFRMYTDRTPPAACFLSHVHSDHLAGLETLKMPFVYCSEATKQILLRMEKYSHRINFQKAVLETRKQTYKHLKLILRALPLETPVKLELRPKLVLQVTLMDANHCPGSVMFLIEGNGKAILYTGDVRAEPWWVNSLVRNPVILPYVCGRKQLDCVYLDTTFAYRDNVHQEFATKAEGLQELLAKVETYPPQTIFYFRAWTLGYEDVWIALAHALDARVHVDDYQMRLYSAVAESGSRGSAALVGSQVGNSVHPGCLTFSDTAEIHSCEPGMDCHARIVKNPNTVWITPIISRSRDDIELAERGAGGGGGDLHQESKLELMDAASIQTFELFCRVAVEEQSQLIPLLSAIEASKSGGSFELSLQGLCLDTADNLSLKKFIALLSRRLLHSAQDPSPTSRSEHSTQQTIHFPYSRHSSFSELRHLVSHFRPRDICPCTVDFQTWSEDISMESLFGDLCSRKFFRHDTRSREQAIKMRPSSDVRDGRKRRRSSDSQETASQESRSGMAMPPVPGLQRTEAAGTTLGRGILTDLNEAIVVDDNKCLVGQNECESVIAISNNSLPPPEALRLSSQESDELPILTAERDARLDTRRGIHYVTKESRLAARLRANDAAMLYLESGKHGNWDDLHLRSTGWRGHTDEEVILGSDAA